MRVNGAQYTIKVDQYFPNNISIQPTIVKIIVNNLISNSLKHTKNGQVSVNISKINDYKNIKIGNEIPSIIIEQSYDTSSSIYEISSPNSSSSIPPSITVGSPHNPLLNYLRIEIRDTGSGIPPALLPCIFDEHTSDQTGTNWDGTGLGLPICLKLCNEVNGYIQYGSKVNVGSVFNFYLPFQGEGVIQDKILVENKKINQFDYESGSHD
eukprot:Mrub_08022.p1 GENE.Mrub_08022~~Mrub_08022.p1  ORF type:complete len:210 (+),score=30.97 Mrub_08022:154-783(+)